MTFAEWAPIVAAVVAGVFAYSARRADSASKLTGAALEFVEALQKQLNIADGKIGALEAQQNKQRQLIDELKERIRRLQIELHEANSKILQLQEKQSEQSELIIALRLRIQHLEKENDRLQIENQLLKAQMEDVE